MIEPTGYTALDLVGFTDRGTYAANVNYVKNDLVHYGGNIWRILIDDTNLTGSFRNFPYDGKESDDLCCNIVHHKSEKCFVCVEKCFEYCRDYTPNGTCNDT